MRLVADWVRSYASWPTSKDRAPYFASVLPGALRTKKYAKGNSTNLSVEGCPCTILIEGKASGTSRIQDLHRKGLYRVTAYNPTPGTDKAMRMHAQTAVLENGGVYLPRSAPWLGDYRLPG